ncbi:P-loop NTPase family protein [Cohnella fermenti]|uniref:Uncharacterized protein n=1 Tax=Cohnella fermenti TaxID=2565925 RepID=A0A4S4BKV8_9BACL|nr:hypothetical protein E6C55_31660 [Cohnella fermenti]
MPTTDTRIAYGCLDAAEEETMAAARRAQLEELIRSMPEELNTVVVERGTHEQLLAAGRAYSRLHRSQVGSLIAAAP